MTRDGKTRRVASGSRNRAVAELSSPAYWQVNRNSGRKGWTGTGRERHDIPNSQKLPKTGLKGAPSGV